MFASAGKLQHTSHCHPGADRGSALCSPRQGNYNTQVTVILGQTEGPRYVRLGRETTTHKSLSSWGRPRVCAMFASAGKLQHTSHCHPGADRGSALCSPRQGNYSIQVTVILGQTEGLRYVRLGRETTAYKSLSSWGRPRVRAMFASAGKLQHTSHCHPGADRGSALCSPRQGNYNTQCLIIIIFSFHKAPFQQHHCSWRCTVSLYKKITMIKIMITFLIESMKCKIKDN